MLLSGSPKKYVLFATKNHGGIKRSIGMLYSICLLIFFMEVLMIDELLMTWSQFWWNMIFTMVYSTYICFNDCLLEKYHEVSSVEFRGSCFAKLESRAWGSDGDGSGSHEDLQPANAVWEGLDYVSIESIGLGHPPNDSWGREMGPLISGKSRLGTSIILLKEEILHHLHQLIGSLSHYVQGFSHRRWLFGISSINSRYLGWRFQSTSSKLVKLMVWGPLVWDSIGVPLRIPFHKGIPSESKPQSTISSNMEDWGVSMIVQVVISRYFLFSPRSLGKMNPIWLVQFVQMGWNQLDVSLNGGTPKTPQNAHFE